MAPDPLNPVEAKRATRQLVLARRDAVDPEARRERSLQICQRLQTVLGKHFTERLATPTIALYCAMKSEVDLASLAQTATEQGWRVCYPIMLKKDDVNSEAPTVGCSLNDRSPRGHSLSSQEQLASFQPSPMAFFTPPSSTKGEKRSAEDEPPAGPEQESAQEILAHPLRRHSFAELEAAGFTYIAPSAIDAIVVPLVAFDSHNFRLGYGGGNYDTFLPQLRQDCLIMGVAFEEQHIDIVPLEPHDLPLPFIVVG